MAMTPRTTKGRTVPQALEIQVDWGEMLFGDVLLFQQAETSGKLTPEVLEALDRVVVGGIKQRKVKETQAILAAIEKAAKDQGDAGN